ncbi:hypothetical protein ASG01_10590 [Chryseobacterium sp. Leaf180]|nr:hypothetical protein ASG01_10590 [Chryseobacterium sp. Leaf180]
MFHAAKLKIKLHFVANRLVLNQRRTAEFTNSVVLKKSIPLVVPNSIKTNQLQLRFVTNRVVLNKLQTPEVSSRLFGTNGDRRKLQIGLF